MRRPRKSRKISQRAARRLQQQLGALRTFLRGELREPITHDPHCVGVVLDGIRLTDYGMGKMDGVAMAADTHVLVARAVGRTLRVYAYRLPPEAL